MKNLIEIIQNLQTAENDPSIFHSTLSDLKIMKQKSKSVLIENIGLMMTNLVDDNNILEIVRELMNMKGMCLTHEDSDMFDARSMAVIDSIITAFFVAGVLHSNDKNEISNLMIGYYEAVQMNIKLPSK